MRRIFIAINLPPELKNKLIKLQEEISQYLPNIRWIKPENLHLTLVFLGEIDDQKTQKVCQITKEAVEEIRSFSLNIKGLGAFPEPRRMKIIWTGALGDSMLKLLNQVLYRKLTSAGFVLDDRAFTPHLTIGRTKDQKPNKEAVFFVLNKFKDMEFGQVEIQSIDMMESQLKNGGPIYKVVEEIKLKSKSKKI